MDAKATTHAPLEEIRLKDLIQEFVRHKWFIGGFAAALACAALVAGFIAPKMYEASIIVSPESNTPGSGQMGGGGLGGLMSQFGGLASLAGLALGQDSRKAESVAVLQSEYLTENYIRSQNLLPVLYWDKWDRQHQRWTVTNPRKIPTIWKAGQHFKKSIREVKTDTKTGLVTMTITWYDPETAAKWANDLVKLTNDYLRTKAINESDRNINYLNQQAAKTDVVGVKQAIYTILQNEIGREMLARGSEEYALKVIDPAIAPELPSSPRKLLWTLLGFFSGLVLALFAVFARMSWERG